MPLPSGEVEDLAVNANDRDSACGADIALEFAPAHRARRIRELLRGGGNGIEGSPLGPEDMRRIQNDTLLGSLASFLPLLHSMDRTALSPAAGHALGGLLAWDGRMEAGSRDAAVFASWRDALVKRLADHPVFAALQASSGHSPVFAPWLSVPGRLGLALETLLAAPPMGGLDLLREATAAFETATSPSGTGTVPEESGATAPLWGELHLLHPLHRLPESAAKRLPATPLSGDGACVLASESMPGVSHLSFRGPVARYVWDLSDRRQSRWIVPFGSAGNPGSPHFLDQLPLWAAGELLPVITDWDRLTQEA